MVENDTFNYDDITPIDYQDISFLKEDIDELHKMTRSMNVEWKVREKALKKIAGICIGNSKKNDIFLNFFNTKLSNNLNIQLKETRSIIVRETSRIISFCAKNLNMYILTGLLKIINKIFLLIPKITNTVILEYISLCLLNIIRYLKSEKIFPNIFSNINSNSVPVRLVTAKCILVIFKEYPTSIIKDGMKFFFENLKILLEDLEQEVKNVGMDIFLVFKNKMVAEAGIFYNSLNKETQKNIIDREKKNNDLNFYTISNKINNKKEYVRDKILQSKNTNINNPNELTYSISNKIIDRDLSKSCNFKIKNTKKTFLLSPNNDSKLLKNRKYQLQRLNQKLMQLNIISGNGDDNQNNNELNSLSQKKIYELKKLNILNDSNFISILLNKNKKVLDDSVINNNYMLIEEKLLMYIYKAEESENVDNKILIFEYLYNDFDEILHGINRISKLTLRKYVDVHVENFISSNKKLIAQILKNLIQMIYYMEQIFQTYNIESIIKISITQISSGDENIILLCKGLLNIIRNKYNNEEIYKILFDVLKDNDVEISNICYEYLNLILPKCDIFFNNIKDFRKIFRILCLNNSNKYNKLNINNISNVIKYFHSKYKQLFDISFIGEKPIFQNNMLSIMEKAKLPFYKEYKTLLEQIKLDLQEEEETLKNEKMNNGYSSIDFNEDNYSDDDDIPKEIKMSLKMGDINQFLNFIDDNINYIPNFLLILSYPKFNESIYNVNLVNFTYALLTSKNYLTSLNSCVELITNQIIHLFLTNTNNKSVINTIKEILNILPFKLDTKKYINCMANYLNTNTDIVLLQALMSSLKYFILTNKHENLEEILPLFIDGVLSLLDHYMDEIRKNAADFCAELYILLGHKFDKYIVNLPRNQQNWIRIFIQKKKG